MTFAIDCLRPSDTCKKRVSGQWLLQKSFRFDHAGCLRILFVSRPPPPKAKEFS